MEKLVLRVDDPSLPNSKAAPIVESNFPRKDDLAKKIIGYDCADTGAGQTVVSLLKEGDCLMKKNNIMTTQTKIQLFQTKFYEKKEYAQCMISYNVYIFRCGLWHEGRNVFQRSYNYMKELTPKHCLDLKHAWAYYDIPAGHLSIQMKNGTGYFNGIVYGSVDGKECEGVKFVDHYGKKYDNVVVQYEINVRAHYGMGIINLKEGTFILENGLRCKYIDSTCYDLTYGHTYWELGYNEWKHKEKVFLIFEGLVNKTVEHRANNVTSVTYFSLSEERMFYVEVVGDAWMCNTLTFSSRKAQLRNQKK